MSALLAPEAVIVLHCPVESTDDSDQHSATGVLTFLRGAHLKRFLCAWNSV